jgi:hypothetical protein
MKLFFHIGIEKTGSSHLQSISAINRGVLQRNGVWFPFEGKNDELLLKGEISSGNAQSITDAIKTNNFSFCSSFIARHIQEAEEKSCHSLFLSNELLLIALAKDEKLNQFMDMLKKLDISDVKFLLFLRDPVDQALSLYKHRAKNGKALDIEEWPNQHYLYGKALNSFLKQAQKVKINLQVRMFSKEKGALEKMLFKEWLDIKEDLIPPPKTVNPSLSLSELMLLKKVRHYQPYMIRLLYDRFKKIKKEDKSENNTIEQYHKNVLSLDLEKYNDTWEICNQFLPQNEKLSLERMNINVISKSDKISSFSDKQMEVIANLLSDSLSFKVRLQIEKSKFKSQIKRLLKTLKLKNQLR